MTYVDARVAHSLAREGLHQARQPLRDIAAKALVALKTLYLQLPRDKSPRSLRRNLPRHIDRLSRTLDADVWMQELNGALFLLFQRTTIDDGGVCSHQFVIDCTNWTVAHKPMVRIKPYALARLMQRRGTMNFEDVRVPVAEAVGRAMSLMQEVSDDGWVQYGVPSSGGLFVGQMDAEETLELATWFVPGLTGQASRWEGYMRDLGAPEVDLTDGCMHDGPTADRYFESLKEWSDSIKERDLESRHPFLLKLHHAQSEYETAPFPILH
jgi:hypothetical protein